MRFRTLSGADGLTVAGARRTGPEHFTYDDGTVLLILSPPRERRWSGVRLVADRGLEARLTSQGWDFRGSADVDALHLEAAEAADLDSDAPLSTVLGAFTELGGPATLGRFLVAGAVLDPTTFAGARCPSEQTALGVYRVARSRDGAFWAGLARLVAQWVAGRVQEDRMVHDLLGEGETHTRFVADAVLLLVADRQPDAVERALAHLDRLAVGHGPTRWWRHDSLEDGSDLVLNTHLHALLARRAAGAVDGDGEAALHLALTRRPSAVRSAAHAADLLVADLGRGALDGRRHAWVASCAHAAEMRAARQRHRHPHLLLPGGRTGRDVRAEPAPAYHTVNTADLASYAAATGDLLVRDAARSAARYARASGHWHALRRDRDPVVLLVPAALLRLGAERAARRWADRLRADGWAPAVGWPGHVDRLWERLPPGVP